MRALLGIAWYRLSAWVEDRFPELGDFYLLDDEDDEA